MTISSELSRAGPYVGNGVVTSFYFSFKIQQPSDIRAVTTDASGTDSTLVYGADYTVTQNADQESSPGGLITCTTVPDATTRITLLRSVKAVQGTALTNQGGFYPKVIENALDKLTMLVQQLSEEVGRAYKTSVVSSATDTIGAYVAQAQEAADEAAAYLASANVAALTSAANAATALQAAINATNAALSAWAAAAAATAPAISVVMPLIDAWASAPALVSFLSIYTPGGWSLGGIAGSSPFSNENFATRRATLSNGSNSFNFGTVP
jgi:hypothetical protein